MRVGGDSEESHNLTSRQIGKRKSSSPAILTRAGGLGDAGAGVEAFHRCGAPGGGQVGQLGAVRRARRAGRVRFEPVSDLFAEVRPLARVNP